MIKEFITSFLISTKIFPVFEISVIQDIPNYYLIFGMTLIFKVIHGLLYSYYTGKFFLLYRQLEVESNKNLYKLGLPPQRGVSTTIMKSYNHKKKRYVFNKRKSKGFQKLRIFRNRFVHENYHPTLFNLMRKCARLRYFV